tara:strand:- start:177 stop:1313 length:1137 start_codon:yes stop_codon:yes gene_type:complete
MRNYSLLSRFAFAGLCAAILLRPNIAAADSPVLNELFPELVNLLHAHDVLHARAFEEIEATNESPSAAIGKRLLMEQLEELAEATASHYHSAGDHLAMLGPHRVFESRAVPGIIVTINREATAEQAAAALAESGTLPPVAIETLKRGREFVEELIEIYLDDSFDDKKVAVDAAVQRYLSDDAHSVAAMPKSDELLSDNPYAYSYRVGFPQLSGLTWASQWLKIATLEVLATAPDQEAKIRDVSNVLQYYKEKTTRLHGSLVSLPSDIPTIPVISPNFYTFHPEASAIVDNIEALKVVIGDALAYPELTNRSEAIESMVADYTNKTEYLFDHRDYLISVLRGGIYNAGGPARGGMERPDRNYSRERQENPHISKFPMPQ